MKPPPFTYHRPGTLDEALDLLGEHGDEAKVLAGGQSLLPLLSLRLAHPAHLVDINRIDGKLSQVAQQDGGLVIGALVRQRAAEASATVRAGCPLLAEALPLIGHVQIRNRGTVCGSLAHADPASELPGVAMALDAQMVAQSRARGTRRIAADAFFRGYLTTALEPDELLTELRLPAWQAGTGWSFQEVARRHGDFALVGVAASLRLDQAGRCQDVRLAAIGASPGPLRGRAAEAILRGQPFSPDGVAAAAQELGKEVDPASDVQATAAYRRHVTVVLARRALEQAAARARASSARES
ncbi:MAG TPA: xanthine dehydrogenase family protein subunit M [Chloroflexota bacterium]